VGRERLEFQQHVTPVVGRGVAVPVAVVFSVQFGGFVAMGLIGLFVGAIVLSVGYKLSLDWLRGAAVANQETGHPMSPEFRDRHRLTKRARAFPIARPPKCPTPLA
jgi:hypothetical protein